MTNQEIAEKLGETVARERKITNEILHLICEASERKIYLEKGYASMFDWLVKFYGYSESAAYRRIQAARLLRAIPQIEGKIVSGQVNLTTLAQVQTTLQKEERRSKRKVTVDAKSAVLELIEGKTSSETQKVLVEAFPEARSLSESLRVIAIGETKLSIVLDDETLALLKEARDLLSHALPAASWSEIIRAVTRKFVQTQKAPPQIKYNKSTSAAVSLRAKRKSIFSNKEPVAERS